MGEIASTRSRLLKKAPLSKQQSCELASLHAGALRVVPQRVHLLEVRGLRRLADARSADPRRTRTGAGTAGSRRSSPARRRCRACEPRSRSRTAGRRARGAIAAWSPDSVAASQLADLLLDLAERALPARPVEADLAGLAAELLGAGERGAGLHARQDPIRCACPWPPSPGALISSHCARTWRRGLDPGLASPNTCGWRWTSLSLIASTRRRCRTRPRAGGSRRETRSASSDRRAPRSGRRHLPARARRGPRRSPRRGTGAGCRGSAPGPTGSHPGRAGAPSRRPGGSSRRYRAWAHPTATPCYTTGSPRAGGSPGAPKTPRDPAEDHPPREARVRRSRGAAGAVREQQRPAQADRADRWRAGQPARQRGHDRG